MAAVRKSDRSEAQQSVHQSGEHAIGLDGMIRRSIEIGFAEARERAEDPHMTARMNAFDLEVAIAESIPSVPPDNDDGAVRISELPAPAVEIDRTK